MLPLFHVIVLVVALYVTTGAPTATLLTLNEPGTKSNSDGMMSVTTPFVPAFATSSLIPS